MKAKHKLLIFIAVAAVTSLVLVGMKPAATVCEHCLPLPDVVMLMEPEPKFNLPYPPPATAEVWKTMSASARLADVRRRVQPLLAQELELRGLHLGARAFLRAFKESRELELWLQSGEEWELFRTYPIAAMSGTLGPKLREGDGQTPEGFYAVRAGSLNPASSYHLSFNIGYPNAYDLHHQRTGSLIMVHGSDVSIGCLAMTDPAIEEIYLVVEAALNRGQDVVPVHIFPFRMTVERLARVADSPWADFWQELLPAYAVFEQDRRPPQIRLAEGSYHVMP